MPSKLKIGSLEFLWDLIYLKNISGVSFTRSPLKSLLTIMSPLLDSINN